MKTRYAIICIASSVIFLTPRMSLAVPASSRQVEQDCAACHSGSFGPQLTSYGRDFKLDGYSMADVKNKLNNLSAMILGGFEHTSKDVPPDSTDHKANNNVKVEQASLFYVGPVAPHVGLFAQATYDGVGHSYSWDNVDLRVADDTKVAGKDLAYGLTINNNPSVQDLWQTAPAWAFPYASSSIAPAPDAAPYITSLGQTVGGAGVYSMWNNLLYSELSGYATLWDNVQRRLGETDVPTSDHLDGLAPYWRIVLQHKFGHQYVSLGTLGLYAQRYPGNDRTTGTDAFLDNQVDATYQYSAGEHSLAVYGSALHEHQTLDATFAAGGSSNPSDALDSYRVTGSYYYRNTYGLTVGRFTTVGSVDAGLYPDPSNNRPDSSGTILQVDVTPFGTEKSPGWSYLNPRFFVQYTAYDKFNGLSKNYDGSGRDASDNNTVYAGTWLSF